MRKRLLKNIVQIVLKNLQESANPQKVEDDWLEQFMNKAGCISSKEFQWIWGKILARECNDPGNIPFALLHTLERMDKDLLPCVECQCNWRGSFADYNSDKIQCL